MYVSALQSRILDLAHTGQVATVEELDAHLPDIPYPRVKSTAVDLCRRGWLDADLLELHLDGGTFWLVGAIRGLTPTGRCYTPIIA